MLFYISQRSVNAEVQRRTKKTQKGKLNMEETTQTTQETPDLETKLAEAEARAAKAEADAERFKKSIDKLTKEAAEKKHAELAKLPEVERKAAEAEEELAKWKEKAEADAKELNHLKAVAAYKNVADESTIERLIDCVAAGDHAEISKVIAEISEKAVKAKEAEWKTSRQPGFVGSGSYPTKTREEILAIKDDDERIRQMAANIDLFK